MTTDKFQLRLDQYSDELKSLYYSLYKKNPYYNVEQTFKDLIDLMQTYYKKRDAKYKNSDVLNPHWYKGNNIVGTTLYLDLFCNNIAGFEQHIPYFKELGINFIHFMPLLEGREGENDGGYAVKNYKSIDKKFGSNKDFNLLINTLKENGIHSCIDFVVNHTAKEHEFAKKAFSGDVEYQNMYFMYDSDEIPKEFERTVPEVFPKVSPGNFTYYPEIKKWVFTSFYEFQWDLNFQNPIVFEKIIDILLTLANKGIDMIRLDAIPFMWKELGHSCRNHPAIHKLIRLMNIINEIVCPSVALLGEAIVEPEEIIKYYGEDAPECHLMYNATHMVNLWNSIATRDTRMLQIDANRLHTLSNGCWINYARCHDDIGWGFNEDAANALGYDPYSHKQFLIHFYKGEFPGSFAVGDTYEFNPENMDARNCGTLASLLGLERAMESKDLYQKELALKRINLIHSILLSSSGVPLIYSGDEIATLNNYIYLDNPLKAHDSRWMHRGHFNHQQALLRKQKETNEGIVFHSLKEFISLRKKHEIFKPTIQQYALDTQNHHVYCFSKSYHEQHFIGLFNFSEDKQFVDTLSFRNNGIHGAYRDLLSGKEVQFNEGQVLLGPYEYLWLIK